MKEESSRYPKFDESVKLNIVDLVTNDSNKSMRDIKYELQNNYSKAHSIGSIYSILKDNGFSYIVSHLSLKLMIIL